MFRAMLMMFVAAVASVAHASVLPSGRCNTGNIKPVSINYVANANLINWDVLCVTNVDPFSSMDYFVVQMTANGDGTYNQTNTIMYKNSTSDTQGYKQSYVNNVILQDTTDSSGTPYHFHLYPLAVSKENAVLYLRCSDVAGVSADTRFIAVPKDTTISDSSLKSLQDTDASYSFSGSLIKLPYSLYPSSTATSG